MLDLNCLAQTVYYEARGESRAGQEAVAHVVVNRSAAWKRPICAIVYQPSQFSWTSQSMRSPFGNSWIIANTIAGDVLEGESTDPTNGALYFHSTSVHPSWANKKRFMLQIGRHKFYR